MKINFEKLNFKNILSYGNEFQTYTFENGIDLISSKNGNGKCLRKNTIIEVSINDANTKSKMEGFLNEFRFGKVNINEANRITLEEITEFYRLYPGCIGMVEVKTRKGYYPIEAAGITAHGSEIIRVETNSGIIEGSPNHRIIANDEWVELKDVVDGLEILTTNGYETITVSKLDFKEDLYDIQVKEVKEYYSNNIVSHNSAILDSLYYSLFGKPYRKIKNGSLINDKTKKKLVVEMYFNVDNKKFYKIQRGQKPSIFVISELKDAEYIEIPEMATTREYQTHLEEEILKLNETVFRQLISISSNSSSSKPFMDLTAKEKEELFQVVTDTSIFNHLEKKIKQRLSDLKIQQKEVSYKLDILSNSIKSERIMQEQAKKQNEDFRIHHSDNVNKTKESINSCIDNIKKYKEAIEKLKSLKAEYDNLSIKIQEYNNDLANITLERDNYIDRIQKDAQSEYNISMKTIEQEYYDFKDPLKDDFYHLQETKEIKNNRINEIKHSLEHIKSAEQGSINCRKCNEVNYLIDIDDGLIDSKDNLINELSTLSNEVKVIGDELSTLLLTIDENKNKRSKEFDESKRNLQDNLNIKITTAREKSLGFKDDEYNSIIEKLTEVQKLSDTYKEKLIKSKHIKETLQEYESNLEYHRGKLIELESIHLVDIDETSLNEKIQQETLIKQESNGFNKKLQDYEYLQSMISIKNENNLKGQVIARTVPFLNKDINYFLEKFSINEINFIIDEKFKEKIISRENDTEYNGLSNGQKMRISFSILFSFLKLIEERAGVSTNLLFLDEILDGSLDAFGKEELLNILKIEFSTSKDIIIISHNDTIKEKTELFNRSINITKDEFSTLSIEHL